VLLIQLKEFKWLLLQEKFTASPGNLNPGPHRPRLPKDRVPVTWGQV